MLNCGTKNSWTLPVYLLMVVAWLSPATSGQTGPQLTPSATTAEPADQLPEPSNPPATDTPQRDDTSIQAKLARIADRQQQLQRDTELSPEIKDQLSKSYEQARIDFEAAAKVRQKRIEATEAVAAAPALLEAAKEAVTEQKSLETSDDLQYMSFEALDQKRLALEAQLSTTTAERTSLTETAARREKRRKELPQLISDTKSKLDQVNQQPAADSSTPQLKEAGEISHDASVLLLTEQVAGYEAEQRRYESEAVLLPLQIEVTQKNEKWLQEQLRIVNDEIEKIRTNRIQATYREASELRDKTTADMKPLVDQLLKKIQAWMELSQKQAQIKTEIDEAQKLLNKWSARRTQMDGRVDPKPGADGMPGTIAGFNSWVGLMLRKQRSELPDISRLRESIAGYQREMQYAESQLFELEDGLQDIKLKEDAIERHRVRTSSAADNDDSAEPRVLSFAADVIHSITLDVNAYQNDLYTLADVRENTIKLTKDYRDFIDRHVLWIRSTDKLSGSDWEPTVEAFRWLVDLQNWRQVMLLIGRDAVDKFGWYALFILVAGGLILSQGGLRKRLADLSAKAEKNNCTNFRLTLRSLLISLLVALPVPLCMLFLYWRLHSVASTSNTQTVATEFPHAFVNGLLLACVVFAPLEILRQLCRPGGLGIKHFGWKEKNSLRLRNHLRWLIDFTAPLSFIIGVFLSQPDQRWEASLGRIAFILTMLILTIFLARVLSLRGELMRNLLDSNRGGWLDRLSPIWYPALVAIPLVLCIVSFVGYHYTAQRIAFHIVTSLWTIVGLVIAYFTMMRWLVLNRRSIMLAQARQRLEEASRREPAGGESTLAIEEPRIDLVAINEQTKRLVNALVVTCSFIITYIIWSDVLPAVSMLDSVQVWPLQKSADPAAFSITLANLLLVGPVIFLVVIAGRNLPGLLEIAFLQHLPLTNAVRYAITTLSRYAIFALGILIISSIFSLHWSSIQWLIAALGVGLGFGLQEIFANFVSGLILLFEQPIRVGDIVTIDGTTGSVSKIRMRATTIVNWERQELIVPNKDLITGKLLNWTLSDSTNRIMVSVGVAYGSDTSLACQLIMDVCGEQLHLLDEPRPTVTFEGFGDNSLNLVIRAFLDSLDHRLTAIHQLHQDIYLAMNKAGIEISFPQRDLHIRTLPESWNRWLKERTS